MMRAVTSPSPSPWWSPGSSWVWPGAGGEWLGTQTINQDIHIICMLLKLFASSETLFVKFSPRRGVLQQKQLEIIPPQLRSSIFVFVSLCVRKLMTHFLFEIVKIYCKISWEDKYMTKSTIFRIFWLHELSISQLMWPFFQPQLYYPLNCSPYDTHW